MLLGACLAQEGAWTDALLTDGRVPRLRSSLALYDDAAIHGQAGELRVSKTDAAFSTPVWGDGVDDLSLFTHVRRLGLDGRIILPDTGEAFPDDLWSLQAGVGYRHRYEGGQIVGGRVSLGSVSDEPFGSADETEVSALGFLRLPSGDRNSWLIFLAFSNNRSFLNYVPLPGLAYVWRPSNGLQATVGLPFVSARWQPSKAFSLSLSAAPVHNVRLVSTWSPLPDVWIEAAFRWVTESWLRADRPEDDDRLYYDEKQVTAELHWRPIAALSMSIGVGYAFGREWLEGDSLTDDDAFNEIDVASSAFATLGITITLGGP